MNGLLDGKYGGVVSICHYYSRNGINLALIFKIFVVNLLIQSNGDYCSMTVIFQLL